MAQAEMPRLCCLAYVDESELTSWVGVVKFPHEVVLCTWLSRHKKALSTMDV